MNSSLEFNILAQVELINIFTCVCEYSGNTHLYVCSHMCGPLCVDDECAHEGLRVMLCVFLEWSLPSLSQPTHMASLSYQPAWRVLHPQRAGDSSAYLEGEDPNSRSQACIASKHFTHKAMSLALTAGFYFVLF